MAQFFSRETAGVLDTQGPGRTLSQNYRSKAKRIRATLILNGQAIGDTIVLGEIPVGGVHLPGLINSTVSLGAATLAIGTAAVPALLRDAAVFTTPNVPTQFGKVGATSDVPAAVTTRIIATIAGAALPVGGTLEIDLAYSDTV